MELGLALNGLHFLIGGVDDFLLFFKNSFSFNGLDDLFDSLLVLVDGNRGDDGIFGHWVHLDILIGCWNLFWWLWRSNWGDRLGLVLVVFFGCGLDTVE